MKSLTLLRLVGVLTLLISLAGIPLYGQGQQPSSQDPAAQSQPSGQESSQSQPRIFVGKITKSMGELVFKDDAGTVYKLDNTDQAKSWVGKTVKITGTLDDATKTIHVTNMEAPSS